MLKRPVLVLMLATALGTTLVACGSDSKTISTKDGEVTVNGDGKDAKVTIKGKDNSSFTVNQGEVPDGFPSEVPLPKGLSLKTAASAAAPSGTGEYFSLGYQLGDKDPADVIADYKSALEDSGFTVRDTGSIGGNTASVNNVSATGKGWDVTATSIGATSGEGVLTLAVVTAS